MERRLARIGALLLWLWSAAMYTVGGVGVWVAIDRGRFVDSGYVPSMGGFSNLLLVLFAGVGAALGLTAGTVLLLVGAAVWRQKPLAYLAGIVFPVAGILIATLIGIHTYVFMPAVLLGGAQIACLFIAWLEHRKAA